MKHEMYPHVCIPCAHIIVKVNIVMWANSNMAIFMGHVNTQREKNSYNSALLTMYYAYDLLYITSKVGKDK